MQNYGVFRTVLPQSYHLHRCMLHPIMIYWLLHHRRKMDLAPDSVLTDKVTLGQLLTFRGTDEHIPTSCGTVGLNRPLWYLQIIIEPHLVHCV